MVIRAGLKGRDAELAELRRTLTAAGRGNGSVVLITGELGVGKTRLMEEFAASTHQDTVQLATGRWFESTLSPPYVGLREAVFSLLQHGEVRAAINRASPYVKDLTRLGSEFADILEIPDLGVAQTAGEDRYRLWQAMVLVLRAASDIAPTVLFLDDLHWADEASLHFLAQLGGEIRESRLLVVGAYRTEDAPTNEPLIDAVTHLTRSRALTTLPLARLSKEDVAAIAVEMATADIAAEFVDLLHEQTDGNPLFIEEMMRSLLASRAQGLSVPASQLELSAGLQNLIERRASRLSQSCRSLLDAIAVAGGACELSTLANAMQLPPDEVLQYMDEGVAAAILREVDPGRFDFAHPLMRNVAYRAMTPSARLSRHLQFAVALKATVPAGAETQPMEVAEHYLAAGDLADPIEVAEACKYSARRARMLFAFDDGNRLLLEGLRALERCTTPHEALRAEMLIELAYAVNGLARPEEAVRLYQQALSIYNLQGDVGGATDVRRWLAGTLMQHGRTQEALEVTTEGVAVAEEERATRYHGLVASHAMALMLTGSIAQAGPWVEKALEFAFDEITTANANHVAAGWHAWGGGDRQRATGYFRKARKSLIARGGDSTAAGIAGDHAVAAYLLGETANFRDAAAEAERLATASGRASTVADLHALRSLIAVQRGDWAAAEMERQNWQRAITSLGSSTLYGQLAQRSAALEHLWKHGPADVQSMLDMTFLLNPPLLPILALELGDRTTAANTLDLLTKAVPASGRGLLWLGAALPIVSAMTTLRQPGTFEWYEALRAYDGCRFDWFLTDIELARICAAAGKRKDAETHFEAALARCEDEGLRPFSGQVLYYRALMLLERRTTADRREARSLLDRAAGMFDELGMLHMRSKALEIIGKPERGRPLSKGPSGLTPREIMVLALLSEGISNRELADRLFVTEKTVEHHLASIYSKLGVNTRAAATAIAVREGLA